MDCQFLVLYSSLLFCWRWNEREWAENNTHAHRQVDSTAQILLYTIYVFFLPLWLWVQIIEVCKAMRRLPSFLLLFLLCKWVCKWKWMFMFCLLSTSILFIALWFCDLLNKVKWQNLVVGSNAIARTNDIVVGRVRVGRKLETNLLCNLLLSGK